MTATHGVGTYGNAVGTVTPLDHKMAQLGDYVKSAANTIRAGLLWDGSTTIVSGKANMSYDVRAFTAVLSRGATLGAVKLANDGVYNVATTAAPGSNSRYDVVYVWQREYSIDGTDSDPVIGVVQGTSAASPSVPSLSAYPGAIELARILVPSGVTATNSGTTITQTAPFTAMSGGVIPFRSTTERDAGSYVEGQLGWLIDTDTLQVYTGSAWTFAAGTQPYVEYRLSAGQTFTTGTTATVDWDATPAVSSGSWSESSGVVTVPLSGYYDIEVWLQWAASSTGIRACEVYKNGTTDAIAAETVSAATVTYNHVKRTIYLAAGDTIRVRCAQNSGGNLAANEFGATKTPGLTIRFVGVR